MRIIFLFVGAAKDLLFTLQNAEAHNALDKLNAKKIVEETYEMPKM